MNKQVKQHVKMFKAGKLWLTAGVVALGMGAATVAATSPVAFADTAAVQAQDGSKSVQIPNGDYDATVYIMNQGSQSEKSPVADLLSEQATATVKGDTTTLTLYPTASGAGADAMHKMLSFTLNGAAGQTNGNGWAFTVPTSALTSTMKLSVSGQMDADLHVAGIKMTKAADSTSASEAPKPSTPASESQKTSTSASESQKPSASTSATPAPSTSAASTSTAAQSTEYKAEFKMVKENSSEASVMDKMFEKPAKVVYSADRKNVTLSFTFGNGSAFGDGNALSGMLKSWTFNGVEATRNGRVWTVTLPASAVKSPIDMKVTYFQSEEAKLVITSMTTMDGKNFDFKGDVTPAPTPDKSTSGSTTPAKDGSKTPASDANKSEAANTGSKTQGTSTSSAATTPVAHKGQQAPAAKTTTTSALPKTAQEAANNSTAALVLAALGLSGVAAYMTYRRKH
ncbi:KxYKxGKxW signal peptide domain-containing protein [Convivina intestini]|uniref:KxYKxGKxW signal peptide domain-containing protein n=1 Tax=Convivina intestini TaxID=1505726 RepID=UPI00200E7F9C|nr:KxYKxGKxW signal peptide domain-containing protein [Convivina intestini]CAH1854892.1 hypothetical protein R078131_01100 [Convivina intestini]